jgi:PAS domain S-box-containing protein
MTDFSLQPIAFPIPENEAERLEALRRYDILDTPPEAAFDRITTLAARLFQVPIALVSFVDESRAWFKSCHGFELQEVKRDDTICSFALLYNEILIVPDTRKDDRFACNPFVQQEPGLRFYAGAPLITQDGFNLGTLCLLDMKPRSGLSADEQATLTDLAAMVIDELELRLAARKVAQIDASLIEITQGISATTGKPFFSALVQHFTKQLAVDYTYIAEVLGDVNGGGTIRTIAVCAKGEMVENFEYSLQGTPCQEIFRQQKLCFYSQDIQTLFPNAPLLKPLGIESYAAVPLFDGAGKPLGILSVMHTKPLTNAHLAEALLTIFALRVTTELERQKTETLRQQAQAQLEQLVAARTAELSQANGRLSQEIADRQKVEAALQREQKMLKVLLDNVQVGIVACNAEGLLTLFNRTARDYHGIPEQPLPPDQWATQYDLYMPDGKTQMPKEEIPLFRALQGQMVEQVEMVIAPKNGSLRTLLASGQAIIDAQGNQQGAVVAMHDITERKRAEAERDHLLREQIREQAARREAEANQQKAAFLAEISIALAASLNYEQTLVSVAERVVPFFADWCAIDLLEIDPVEGERLQRVAIAHSDSEKAQIGWELSHRYPQSIDAAEGVPKVCRTRQSDVGEVSDAFLKAMAQDENHLHILQTLGFKSYLLSPLMARGQVLGAISFITAESDRRYTQLDLSLAEDIAHRVAIAIDNARLYREAQQAQQAAERSAERIARLQTVTAAFSESLTPAQVADVVVEHSIAVLGANFAMVALLNEAGTELETIRLVGCEEARVEGEGEPANAWQRFPLDTPSPLSDAVRTGQPIWMESSEQRIARYPHLAEVYRQNSTLQSWISLPLMVERRVVGGMSFGFKTAHPLQEEEQAFILALAQQCAQAIVRAHLYEAERIARNEAVREAERSAEANRMKDEFLAILSHELRSPLNPILGWVKLLRNGSLDAAKTSYALETIERNAKLQTQLIEDLLDVSRILRGKLSLNTAPVNLIATVQSALETVRLAAEAKNIQIQTQLHTPKLQVLGDSARLQQVVWNLLTNAVKFTPAGGQVQIDLRQICEQSPSRSASSLTEIAQITVRDTGKGIPSDFLPHVFEYFRQADSTTTRQFGGLGLGLAIVRHLVELHGGSVFADSAGENQGATFTVQLPLLKSKATQPEETVLTTTQDQPLQGIQVLLVDDEPDARDLMVFVLQAAGAIVQATASVQEAFATLQQFRPDVLVSDIGMPEENGYSLMIKIRQQAPEVGSNIPAIALTAYAREEDREQAFAAGFQKHLSKPVVAEDLIAAILDLVPLA